MLTRRPMLMSVVVAAAVLFAACGGGSSSAAPSGGAASAGASAPALQIPDIEQGKFNVAMVLIGPHDDGGWSQAHYEGLKYVEQNVPNASSASSAIPKCAFKIRNSSTSATCRRRSRAAA